MQNVLKRKAYLGGSCVFEPPFRHSAAYSNCNMNEGLVTIDDDTISLGTFNIVMTNRSNKHIKVNNNQTVGMLWSCEDNQIWTVHEIMIFDQNCMEGKYDKSESKPEEGHLHYVPTKHPKTGRIKVNTFLRKDFYPVEINEAVPQQDYMHYKKPSLLDTPTDIQTRDDLEKLHKENHDIFADGERGK